MANEYHEPSFRAVPGPTVTHTNVRGGPNQDPGRGLTREPQGFQYTPFEQPSANEIYRRANQAKIDKVRAQMLEKAGEQVPGTTVGRRLMSDVYRQNDEQRRQTQEEADAQHQAGPYAFQVPESMLPPQERQRRKEARFAQMNAEHDRKQARVNQIRNQRGGQS